MSGVLMSAPGWRAAVARGPGVDAFDGRCGREPGGERTHPAAEAAAHDLAHVAGNPVDLALEGVAHGLDVGADVLGRHVGKVAEEVGEVAGRGQQQPERAERVLFGCRGVEEPLAELLTLPVGDVSQ